MDMIAAKGPIHASVYWARPPVRFGISALSSDKDNAVIMLTKQAMTMAMIKLIPRLPAPCPRDMRQLVATISPTPTAMTLGRPNFFSFILSPPLDSVSYLIPARKFLLPRCGSL